MLVNICIPLTFMYENILVNSQFLDFLVDRWGLTWFVQPEDAWRKKYPHVTKKIDELETRIKELESGTSKRKKS